MGECPVSLLRGSPKITNFQFTVVSGTVNLNGAASVSSSGAIFLHDSDLKIDGSLIVNGGGLNVRGASHITMNSDFMSRVEIGAGAFLIGLITGIEAENPF